MLHELWDDPADDGRFTFCLRGFHGNEARQRLSAAARLVWTVEANSSFDAMTLYWRHQGWGTYTSSEDWEKVPYAELGWSQEEDRRIAAREHARFLTEQLRSSQEPLFARLRTLLPEHGLPIEKLVMGQLFADDVDQEFGVAVTDQRRAFTFVLHYARRGDLGAQTENAVLHPVKEITESWSSSAYRDYVQGAFEVMDEGSARS